MEQIVYRITLDAHKTGTQRLLQGFETADNVGRKIMVSLQAAGTTYEIPRDHVIALMYVTIPDVEGPEIYECLIEDNMIIYEVNPVADQGIIEMQIKLIDTGITGAKKVLAAPRFAIEVVQSNMNDEEAEASEKFGVLENALARAKEVYDARLLKVEIGEDYVFRAYYADGAVYENDALRDLVHTGNSVLSESYAKGGTGTRTGEDTDNSKYYSNVSRSASKDANIVSEEARKLLEEARLHTSFTTFNVDFETGELVYMSSNYNFDINEENGNLEATSEGNYNPEQIVGSVVDGFIEKKSQEIDADLQEADGAIAELQAQLSETNAEVATVRLIAVGRNQSIAYDTYAEMVTALNAMEKASLSRGQNIYIGTVGVPDLWVYSVEESAVAYEYIDENTLAEAVKDEITVQIGHFKVAQLETQKVDLNKYLLLTGGTLSGPLYVNSVIIATQDGSFKNLLVGNKHSVDDGQTGVYAGARGYIQIQSSGDSPFISFALDDSCLRDAEIALDYDTKYLAFRNAARYVFANHIEGAHNLYLGTNSATAEYGIIMGWIDGSNHAILARGLDGLTTGVGWAGSSAHKTVTNLRGQTCQVTNASGTSAISDERLKKDFTKLDRWELFYDTLEPCAFKLKSGSSGRYHIGFKAQQVEQALLDNGLTTQDFAGFIKTKHMHDSDSPEGNAIYEAAGINEGDDEYGLIYTEFVAMNTHEIQKLKKENRELKERLATIEDLLGIAL